MPDSVGVVRVAEWMTPDPVTVTPTTDVATARNLLHSRGFRHLPVVDGPRLRGIVSDRDVGVNVRQVRSAIRAGALDGLLDDARPVAAVMSTTPHRVRADAPLVEAVRLMVSRRIHALPVIDDRQRLVGIITSMDCLLAALAPDGRRPRRMRV